MLGLILCGGQSSRMGTDKGMLKIQDATWAQTAVEKMSALNLKTVLSVNDTQYKNYAAFFSAEQLVKDSDLIDVKGPLHGLLSVHLKYPAEDLFVLACDMPLMEATILKQLMSYYEKQTAAAYVYTNDGEQEPLCAIYKAAALAYVLQQLQTNQLAKYSMKYVLGLVNTFSVPLADDQKKCFRNCNAQADLYGL